ncbi:MAG: hypothetical protein DRH26_00085 [Deltaproteobacteria bacterium]|nr:MAG: hypothetical protein DRH26_00085 [Deltaproteobacteria bacterium]
MTGADLLTTIRSLLLDPDNGVWSDVLKVAFVNEAMNTIVALRPDSTAVTAEVALTSGTPKQAIPATGAKFLDLIRNVDGRAITKTDRGALGKIFPDWPTQTGSEVNYYMFDAENPTSFWVFPTPSTGFSVEMVYAGSPTVFTADASSLGLPDIYIAPITEYVLYRALNMQSAGQNTQKASMHLQNFYTAIGAQVKGDSMLAAVQEG